MKNLNAHRLLQNLVLCAMLMLGMNAMAANTVTTQSRTITSAVTVSTAVDYTITASTPFSDNGSVNITNTNHAAVIFKSIKPFFVTNLN